MDDILLQAGDRFQLSLLLHNPESESYRADIWILLDVFGSYWCYPSWVPLTEDVDYQAFVYAAAESSYYEEVLDFTWPDGAGAQSGLRFFGAAFEAGSYEFIGELAIVNWGSEY